MLWPHILYLRLSVDTNTAFKIRAQVRSDTIGILVWIPPRRIPLICQAPPLLFRMQANSK